MIALHDPVDPALSDRVLADLDAHAAGQGQSFAATEIGFEARADGRHLGGLVARLSQRWMFIALLAVAHHARGRGLGTQLLAAAEAEARRRACIGIWLDTYSFQAPGFYRRQGFVEIGRIDDYPKGEARFFFQKRLDR